MNASSIGFAFGPRLGPLDPARAEALRAAHGRGPVTYAEHGATNVATPTPTSRATNVATPTPTSRATNDAMPDGYFHVDRSWTLGTGDACFDAARRALLDWRVFPRQTWFRVTPAPERRAVGEALLFDVRAAGFWWGSLLRVLDLVDEPDRVAITVGTLAHHHARGEERFAVERMPGGEVVYRLRSFSVWNRAWTRAFSPVARRLQRRFGDESGETVRAAVAERLR